MIGRTLFLTSCLCFFAASASDYNKEKVDETIRNFKILDANNDGEISYAEFKQNGAKVYTERAPADEHEWNVLYDVIDISDNLAISLREFIICDYVHNEFKYYDGDNNGRLSKGELLNAIDISDEALVPEKATFLEYFARVFTDEKLISNWETTVGKV